MNEEQREQMERDLSDLIGEWVRTCRTMGIRFTADDCAEFVVGGADWPGRLLAEERRAGHAEGQNLANEIVAAIVAQAEREARRAGAEQGWADGWSAHKMLGDALPLSENPYRTDQIAQDQP